MTKFDELLFDTVGYLEDLGLDVFLHSSTLLRIARKNKLIDGGTQNKELNIGCLYEDITPKILDKIIGGHPFAWIHNDHRKNHHLIFFSREWDKRKDSVWAIKTGFTLLAPFYKEGDLRIEYMGNDRLKCWPRKLLDDKKKWGKIKYLGREFNTPSDYKKWFRIYFGSDWRTNKPDWSWQKNALNLKDWDEVYKGEDIIKKE